MPLWQRLPITLAIMIMTSLIAGLLWRWLFRHGYSELFKRGCRRRFGGAVMGAAETD